MTRISIDGYEPAHLSFSTVAGYRDCGLRLRLQKIMRKEQRPGLAGIGGNAVHTATEWADGEALPEHGWPTPDMFDPNLAFEIAWSSEIEKRKEQSPSYKYPEDYIATGRASAEHGGKRGVSWWMEQGPIMVQRWIDWRQNGWSIWETPEGNPGVEVELNIVLPGDIPVKMFIDRLMVTPAGQLAVVDIKSGREPETPEQLGLYACGIELTWGPEYRPAWGFWWDASKGTHSQPMDLSRYTVDYFAGVYDEAVRGINAGCFLAKPANRCSTWCSVAYACPAVGGSLSAQS